ncbi:hypothetical protein [Pleionea sediminis]|uniref:hypothetical protein n=1 Tax=Pleionea sediminis TaxID=2569479 RepID=UPI0013DE0232|nr:hypothetical protein [Pleionea sediminis]
MVEDIVLESPDRAASQLLPPVDKARHVNYEYEVKPKFSPNQYCYRIFNNAFLEIEKRDKHGKKIAQTAFHLGLLEPKPKKSRSTAWFMFIGAILTAVAAMTMGLYLNDLVLAAGTGAFSLMLFIVHYCSYREISFFYSRSGKAPLVALSHRCGCKKSLRKFVEHLKRGIEKNTLPASSQYFAEETRWHRTLKDEGWISNEDYQKARNRIMKQFNRRVR